MAERCQCVASSFFESVPTGPDAYLMWHILHWDDAESIAIAMSSGALRSGSFASVFMLMLHAQVIAVG